MTEETAIRIAEGVEKLVRSVEAMVFQGWLVIAIIAGIYIAILLSSKQ